MKELIIDENEGDQRLDRYIRKYLNKAPLGFIYKQIRKKNIVVNDKKAKSDYNLKVGDSVKIYFADDTIDKFREVEKHKESNLDLDIIYEDENILLINKPAGVLSHAANGNHNEENIVDAMISYLIDKKDYIPRKNPTFTPSIVNRLDRNTSGIIIGGKNYTALQELNKAQRKNAIKKYYFTIVKGKVSGKKIKTANIKKVKDKENLVSVSEKDSDDNKSIITGYRTIKTGRNYSLLEVDLITGRTHQIRAHLSFLDIPIIGDRKYGDKKINKYFQKKYNLNNQLLHCHKILFEGLEGDLSYLNDKSFETGYPELFKKIIKGEIYE